MHWFFIYPDINSKEFKSKKKEDKVKYYVLTWGYMRRVFVLMKYIVFKIKSVTKNNQRFEILIGNIEYKVYILEYSLTIRRKK